MPSLTVNAADVWTLERSLEINALKTEVVPFTQTFVIFVALFLLKNPWHCYTETLHSFENIEDFVEGLVLPHTVVRIDDITASWTVLQPAKGEYVFTQLLRISTAVIILFIRLHQT